jgi:putative hydrolase of the HAD superfamily
MTIFDIIALDADDTLWHTERLYVDAQAKFKRLLLRYHNPDLTEARLYQTEMRNLEHFGYGVKAFALSMIETAIELTDSRVSSGDLRVIIDMAKDMLNAEVELLDHVAEAVPQLAASHTLMVVTKGDLLDQQRKLALSGLELYFQHVEIISDKNQEVYAALLNRYGLKPERFLMVGNSVRSDILPVLALGAWAVHIPYQLTWMHETADPPGPGQPRYYEIEHLGLLPALLERIYLL